MEELYWTFYTMGSIGCIVYQWPSLYGHLVRRLRGINSKQYQLQGACLYNSIEEGPNVYQTWMSYIECFVPPVVLGASIGSD